MRRFRINEYGEIMELRPRRERTVTPPKRGESHSRPRTGTVRSAAQRESQGNRPCRAVTASIMFLGLVVAILIVCIAYSQNCRWAVALHVWFTRLLRF